MNGMYQIKQLCNILFVLTYLNTQVRYHYHPFFIEEFVQLYIFNNNKKEYFLELERPIYVAVINV